MRSCSCVFAQSWCRQTGARDRADLLDTHIAGSHRECMQYAFLGGSADNIKKYKLPDCEFAHNMIQNQASIINSMAINEDGVVASGADNGSLWCAHCPCCFEMPLRLCSECAANASCAMFVAHSGVLCAHDGLLLSAAGWEESCHRQCQAAPLT